MSPKVKVCPKILKHVTPYGALEAIEVMASKLFKCVILGAPASGKGTISNRIVKHFNLEHISSGDKLRMEIKNSSVIGNEVKQYTTTGKLVPDSVMVKFIVSEIYKLNGRAWLLDGFPRTVSQAESLFEVQPLNVAINLVVPYDVIIDRVKHRWVHLPSGRVYNLDFNAPKVKGVDDITGEPLMQREDDKPQVVAKRLQDYDKITRPVIEFYKQQGILREFKGSTSDEIWPQVKDCLTQYLPLAV